MFQIAACNRISGDKVDLSIKYCSCRRENRCFYKCIFIQNLSSKTKKINKQHQLDNILNVLTYPFVVVTKVLVKPKTVFKTLALFKVFDDGVV